MPAVWPLAVLILILGLLCAAWALWRALRRRTRPATAPAEQDSTQRLLEELARLEEYAILKAETPSRREFCELLLSGASRLAGSERGALIAFDEVTAALQEQVFMAPAGNAASFLERPEQLVERAFKSQSPAVVPAEDGRTLIAVPLLAQSKPLAILEVQVPWPVESSMLPCLRALAGTGALILHQMNLFERLQAFHMELVETLYRTVHAAAPGPPGQAEMTRLRARRLAEALRLPESLVRHVEYAALLRGVGKVGIDQTILNKPGLLTPKEYEEIKKHTTIGHRILSKVRLLAPAAKMVLYHQEWYNGRGYPEGLKGEEIPLGARIIAVVSAWEAMRSDRPYRKALDPEAAMAELARATGTQFDPSVVETFQRLERLKE